MGLFDFFKKKDQAKEKKEIPAPPKEQAESIEIIALDNGSHGDHFGGLIGFPFLNTEEAGTFINQYMALASTQKATMENEIASIHDAKFSEGDGDSDKLGIRTIKTQDKLVSAYPYLQTEYTVPFGTKQIFEWSHIGNLEAEVKGGGRDTFGFGFFATDYAVNRAQYRANKNLNIKVSAIGLVLDKSDLTEIGGQKVSEGFASYMPSQDIPRPTYYDFIGVLIDYQAIKIAANNTGYILKVKLINHEEDPNFFTVDLFINQENMRIDHLEKGMRITGALWFQGEIA